MVLRRVVKRIRRFLFLLKFLICIYSSTFIRNFSHFARLLADVDLSGFMPETLVSVVYENLPVFCNNIGHVVDCRSLDRGKKHMVKKKVVEPLVKQVYSKKYYPWFSMFLMQARISKAILVRLIGLWSLVRPQMILLFYEVILKCFLKENRKIIFLSTAML